MARAIAKSRKGPMLLSIIVPCHNEETVVDQLTETVFESIHIPETQLELILVDDGSRDSTVEKLRVLSAKDSRIKYLSFSRNFGKEAAMYAGLQYANGDAVVIMDADLQHPPELVNEMVEHYREGFDQVVARRTRDGDKPGRTFLSRVYYRLVNRMVDVPLEDGVGDFRLMSRQVVEAVLSMGEANRFSKGLFSWVGFKRYTIDYKNQARVGGGESKWSIRSLFNYGIDSVMSFNNKPLRFAIYTGLFFTFLALIYVIYLIISALVYGVETPGYVTTIATIVFMGGLQIMFLGVVGEYVGRIYYETKHRPIFIVAESAGFENR